MTNTTFESTLESDQRQTSLSRWDSEGGAGILGPQMGDTLIEEQINLSNAELVKMRVRIIALENLVIALLANSSERQIDTARTMATQILPRPGYTQHPLTINAAGLMIDLIDRAGHFRETTNSE
jgi:hypothetical protein